MQFVADGITALEISERQEQARERLRIENTG